MIVIALDIGEKRIGIAVSDPLGIIAQGLPTITNTGEKDAVGKIKEVVTEYKAEKLVIGLPQNLNGTLGKQAEYVLGFIRSLKKELDLEIITWDERFSSLGVERVLLDAGVRREKRKKSLDKLSAQWILQGYLEKQRHERI